MFEKTYSVEDFKMALNSDVIKAAGCVDHNSKHTASINYSNIITKLIQVAGRLVDAYASDLLYEIEDINETMQKFADQITAEDNGVDCLQKSFLFGFREQGVDSTVQVIHKYESPDMYNNRFGAEYREVWKLELLVTADGKISMQLYKVDKCI